MEPTGRREAPPDDRLRAIRERDGASKVPDFAALHPGYELPSHRAQPFIAQGGHSVWSFTVDELLPCLLL